MTIKDDGLPNQKTTRLTKCRLTLLLFILNSFIILNSTVVLCSSSDQGTYWLLSDSGMQVKVFKDNLHVEVQKGSGSVWVMDSSQSYDIEIGGTYSAFSSSRSYSQNGNSGLRVTISEQSATLHLNYVIDPQGDLIIEIDPYSDPNKIMSESRYPRPFSANQDSYVYPYGEGGLVDASRLISDEEEIYANNGISMPWWGVALPR